MINPVRPYRMVTILGLLAAAALFVTGDGRAGGILHVTPPEIDGQAFAVARPTVLLSKTLVTVSESSVDYLINQTFYNDNEFPVTGLFVLPLGKEKPRSEPEIRMDGIAIESRTLSPDEFFLVLKELSLAMKDPSLLGLAGSYVLVVRPVNLAIKQQKSFRVKYRTHLTPENDMLDLVVRLDGERYSLGPVGELEVLIRFKAARTVRTVFSPTHHISVYREAPHRCVATLKSNGRRIKKDLRTLTTFSGDPLDLRVFTHGAPGRDGTFMAFISPPAGPDRASEEDKDVVLVLDCSGSMAAKNLKTAKAAVRFCLDRLRPRDRFNVLTLSTRVGKMADRLLPATERNVLAAVKFVNAAGDSGGTDLYNGMIGALEQFTSRKRPSVVIMATDGRATVGVTDPNRMIEDLRRNNKFGARLFVMALGESADVAILDRMAVAAKGRSMRYAGDEEFESFMTRFFAGVSPPKVSRLSLAFPGLAAEQIYPDPIPDLFGRDSLVVVGRYTDKKSVTSRVRLRGILEGKAQTVTRTCRFPDGDPAHPYIPAIWAMRRLAPLIEADRSDEKSTDTAAWVKELAARFGFRVPRSLEAPGQAKGQVGVTPGDVGTMLWTLRKSVVPGDVESDKYRHADGRVFRREGTRLIETEYAPEMKTEKVTFLGEDYFALLKRAPNLGPYLALGPEVTLINDNVAVEVISSP